jgi:transcriptional regulator with XRE-family HTH domain
MNRTGPLETIAVALRRERERHGISLTELARRAGIAKSTLSQLEAGAGNPSVETLWALAVVLEVPFSRLVDPPAEPVQVIRAGEGLAIRSEQAPFAATLLAACPPGARRDLHVMSAEPGAAREAHAHIRGTTEHVIVAAGRWRAGPAGGEVELGPGDYARFPGDRPHSYEALEPGTAVLVMEYA